MIERAKYEEQLSDEEVLEVAPALKGLVQHPGWRVYLELLRGYRIFSRELAFREGQAEFSKWQGVVMGLQQAEEIIPGILQAAEEVAAGQERKTGLNP